MKDTATDLHLVVIVVDAVHTLCGDVVLGARTLAPAKLEDIMARRRDAPIRLVPRPRVGHEVALMCSPLSAPKKSSPKNSFVAWFRQHRGLATPCVILWWPRAVHGLPKLAAQAFFLYLLVLCRQLGVNVAARLGVDVGASHANEYDVERPTLCRPAQSRSRWAESQRIARPLCQPDGTCGSHPPSSHPPIVPRVSGGLRPWPVWSAPSRIAASPRSV